MWVPVLFTGWELPPPLWFVGRGGEIRFLLPLLRLLLFIIIAQEKPRRNSGMGGGGPCQTRRIGAEEQLGLQVARALLGQGVGTFLPAPRRI